MKLATNSPISGSTSMTVLKISKYLL